MGGMRVLIVSPYFPPRNAIGALRVHAFARCWAEAGDRVTVLTTAKREHQREHEMPAEGFEVVEIDYRVSPMLERLRHDLRAPGGARGGGPPRNGGPGALKTLLRRVQDRSGIYGSMRMPDFTDSWVKPALEWAAHRGPWDVVFSSAGPYTAHLVALALKDRGAAPRWVAEYRDLWTGNRLHRGLFPFTLRERRLDRRCMRAADLLVTVSEPLAEVLARRSRKPVEVIYNGFDPDELLGLDAAPAFPADGALRIVFTGTLYPAGQDPGPILDALAALPRDRVRLVVAGPSAAAWRAAAERHGVAGLLDARGPVPRPEARRMQRDAGLLLLVDFDSSLEGVLTGKAFEYLSVTAPILAVGGDARSSPIAGLLRRSGRGAHFGRDRSAIAAALRMLLDAASPLPGVGPPDEAYLQTLTRRHQAHRLHSFIRMSGCTA
jgi:hypothetical protein